MHNSIMIPEPCGQCGMIHGFNDACIKLPEGRLYGHLHRHVARLGDRLKRYGERLDEFRSMDAAEFGPYGLGIAETVRALSDLAALRKSEEVWNFSRCGFCGGPKPCLRQD